MLRLQYFPTFPTDLAQSLSKSQLSSFAEIDKHPEIHMEMEEFRLDKTIFKKNKAGGLTFPDLKTYDGASLVAQWLRIRLPMQGTRVRALVWEDPTCRGATKPVSHNY